MLDLRRLSLEMPLFSRKKDKSKKSNGLNVDGNALSKPKWEDSWLRTRVDPEEVAELLHGCTGEIKSRGMAPRRYWQGPWLTIVALDVPFLLLPFRPSSDPSAAKSFVRNYFYPPSDRKKPTGPALMKELKMAEVMVSSAAIYVGDTLTSGTGHNSSNEMVLGTTPRRSGDMGSVSGF